MVEHMIDIVDRLEFDATRCEVGYSKGVASNITEGIAEIKRLRERLDKISKDRNVPEILRQYARGDLEPTTKRLVGERQP